MARLGGGGAAVHLRPVTTDNLGECLALRLAEPPTALVASNAKSLAEAKVNPSLVPLAIYDVAARGHERPAVPMVGFVTYEVTVGIGFVLRLMIDGSYQRRGYGRAAMVDVIRRLTLTPEVELIATSHRHANKAAARLFQGLGFVPWAIEWAKDNPDEVFLRLTEEAGGWPER